MPTGGLNRGWTGTAVVADLPTIATDEQRLLFPKRVHTILPTDNASKDLLMKGVADDGMVYFLKGDVGGKPVMASEWLATRIAQRLGLAVADCTAIQTPDGQIVFGSQQVSTVSDEVETAKFVTTMTVDENGKGESFPGSYFSMILAFDYFVNNVDRHLGNFLSKLDGSVRRLYAIDFGRSLFWNWPLDGFPTSQAQTVIVGQRLRKWHRFDENAAMQVIEGIKNLEGSAIELMIGDMPEGWLTEKLAEEFLSFWNGAGRQLRLDRIVAELKNGPTA
jgi:hypothetical protein